MEAQKRDRPRDTEQVGKTDGRNDPDFSQQYWTERGKQAHDPELEREEQQNHMYWNSDPEKKYRGKRADDSFSEDVEKILQVDRNVVSMVEVLFHAWYFYPLRWFSLWLPEDPNRQIILQDLYSSLCRDKGKLVAFLKEPFTPIVPVEPKVPKIKPEKKESKKFSREVARKLLESGLSYSEIASIFGISRVAVWKALNMSPN